MPESITQRAERAVRFSAIPRDAGFESSCTGWVVREGFTPIGSPAVRSLEREDGIISSRDEIFPVNSLVAYPYRRVLLETKRKLEETGADWLRVG